jgi:glycosidase
MPRWLEDAVFYEIYPQTFFDSNADGIGDLPGITQKLDYLQYLGVNALWLNPCFESPFQDAGYDVSDFYKVAPRYGTNEDLRALFAEAGKRGIRVILDLVAGHTSAAHPWFRESCRQERNQYSDWFIWTDSVWAQNVPGQQLVIGYAERDGNYLPNFFHFQPALNYGFATPDPAHPWQQPVDSPGPKAVRAELRKIMKFWLDLGASGFRVDMAGSLVKDDPGGRETSRLWREIRAWLDRDYPEAAIVSEWSNPAIAIPAGFHVDFLLPFASPGYQSLFRKPAAPDANCFFHRECGDIRAFLDEYQPLLESTRGKGWIAIPSGNHDTVPRLGDGRDVRDLAVAFLFLLSMPGVPFIYYGDEIGMRSTPDLPSKEGGYNRTGARTPMQWDGSDSAGFSTAPTGRWYLPEDPAPGRPAVDSQRGAEGTLLEIVRRLIALRKEHVALQAGGLFEPVYAEKGKSPFLYRRKTDGEEILVGINPAEQPCELLLPKGLFARAPETLFGDKDAFRLTEDGWLFRLPGVSGGMYRANRAGD